MKEHQRARVKELLSKPQKLTEWEKGFLGRLEGYNTRRQLSENELKKLNQIYQAKSENYKFLLNAYKANKNPR